MVNSGEAHDRTYRVGHVYRDRASKSLEDDEFLNWLNSGGKTIANSSGIRYRAFLNQKLLDPESNRSVPAFFVLVTSGVRTQSHNPWDDITDHRSGEILYWGDAKHGARSRYYDDFPGNARIIAANPIFPR